MAKLTTKPSSAIYWMKGLLVLLVLTAGISGLYYRSLLTTVAAPLLFVFYSILLGIGSKTRITKSLESIVADFSTSYEVDEIFFEKNPKVSLLATVRMFWPVCLYFLSCANMVIFIQNMHLLDTFNFLLPKGHPSYIMAIKMCTAAVITLIFSRLAFLTSRKIVAYKIDRYFVRNPISTIAGRS